MPDIILPNGRTVLCGHMTAQSYEQFRTIQQMWKDSTDGMEIDHEKFLDLVDAVLKSVLPLATPDDLASFGARIDMKMAVITAAAGGADDVVAALEAQSKPVTEGNEEALLG
jgi:hypothetical protein